MGPVWFSSAGLAALLVQCSEFLDCQHSSTLGTTLVIQQRGLVALFRFGLRSFVVGGSSFKVLPNRKDGFPLSSCAVLVARNINRDKNELVILVVLSSLLTFSGQGGSSMGSLCLAFLGFLGWRCLFHKSQQKNGWVSLAQSVGVKLSSTGRERWCSSGQTNKCVGLIIAGSFGGSFQLFVFTK